MTFEEIYDRYKKQVYNLALHYVQNTNDAQEITQDVFVSIHQSLSGFKAKSLVSTWIYRITINKSLDFIKAKRRKKRLAFLAPLFYPDTNEPRHDLFHFEHPGIIIEQKETVQRIFNLINQLPDSQKTALILSKIEHKSQQEIAEIMGLSAKAVESLIQRAKAGLAKKINNSEGK